MNTIVYHKTSCITCKKAIAEMDRMKIDIEKRDFFKDPFTEEELKKIIKLSGLKARELLRKKDKMYKELDLENTKFTDKKIVQLMVRYPGLIKRPIIFKDKKIHLGKLEIQDLK